MEEELEVKEVEQDPPKRWYNAKDLFTPISEEVFRKAVMTYVKAYYKAEYSDVLLLHEHVEDDLELYMYIQVDRDEGILYFYNDALDSNACAKSKIKSKGNIILKPKDYVNYFYYEYRLHFADVQDIENGVPIQKEIKKSKITL